MRKCSYGQFYYFPPVFYPQWMGFSAEIRYNFDRRWNMNQQKIGEYIAKKRKEHNMTQIQLAEKLGVSNKSVSNSAGKGPGPTTAASH